MTRSKLAARKKERRALRRQTALRLVNLAIARRTAELDQRLAAMAAKGQTDEGSVYRKRVERVKQIIERLNEDRANLIKKMGPQLAEFPASTAGSEALAVLNSVEPESEEVTEQYPFQPDE